VRFHLGTAAANLSFSDLVNAMPEDAFSSPRRSTVFLLDFWRDPGRRLVALASALGVSTIGDADLHFEYPVQTQGGVGKSSFTDLMITAPSTAIAIEAKHREPAYQSCGKWLGAAEPGSNCDQVLNGWIDCINSNFGSALDRASVAEFPYQLVHRTASLATMRGSKRYLIYQVFEEGSKKAHLPDLKAFRTLLKGSSELYIGLMNCPCEPVPNFKDKLDSWDKGPPREPMAEIVRRTLLAGPVFVFEQPTIQLVTD
jgi:hypothetical protein